MSPTVAELLATAAYLDCLTLHEPWAWGVAEAGKDVENRTWDPPPAAVGKALAIHAGQTYDMGGALSMREALGLNPPERHTCKRGVVVAVAVLARVSRHSPSPWARAGDVHWCLEGTVRLPKPVVCKGAQGLWRLSPTLLVEVRRQVREASEWRQAQARAAVALSASEGPPTGHEKAAAEAWNATRVSHRAWSKGSARGAGPTMQTGTVRIKASAGIDFATLAPRCGSCGKPQEKCRACGTWWCSAPGHLRHRCEPGWPRCAHGETYWATSTEKPVPPECCRPADWWQEQEHKAGAS